MITFFKIKLLDEEQDFGMFIAIQERIFDTIMSGIAEISDVRSTHSFTLKFHRINENVLKRFLTKGDMHAFEHTLEAVRNKTIRRSGRMMDKPSQESVITMENDVEYHRKKMPAESIGDDSVFEEVNLRTPEVRFRDRSSTSGQDHKSSTESLRRTHLRHTMHVAERNKSTREGKKVVSNMFHQSQYYHLPLRDSIVTPASSPKRVDTGSTARESAFKFPSRQNSDQVSNTHL
jgi:hypothetical protein